MSRNKLYIILTCSVLFAVFFSCKKTAAPNLHFNYFANFEGNYNVYDVVDITHDTGAHDTLRYQIKTVWGETYIDNEGRANRKFRRYKRLNSIYPWVLKDTWYGMINGIRAELVEENQRTVKLVFSPTSDKEWDANAYNTFAPLTCYYDDIHLSKSIGNLSFDSTVVVEQANQTSLIDTIRKYEVYAKNVGLIYKYYKENDYQLFGAPVNGKELYYTIIETGIE